MDDRGKLLQNPFNLFDHALDSVGSKLAVSYTLMVPVPAMFRKGVQLT